VARHRLRQAIKELKRGGSNGRDLVSRRDLRSREEDDLADEGVPPVSQGEREIGYHFGILG
jgi:hypothetical protein